MLCSCEALFQVNGLLFVLIWFNYTFGGWQMSHSWTESPFFALLTLPVTGVSLTGVSPWPPGVGRFGLIAVRSGK